MYKIQQSKTLWMVVGVILVFAIISMLWLLLSPAMQVFAAPFFAPKPVDGWYVCRNLGYGYVPGLGIVRQRLKLCNDLGWEVYTYCTQPGIAAPPVGRSCQRIGAETYRCGGQYQLVREYRILQTPTNTSAPLQTVTPTSTRQVPIQTATPTATQRVRPGGSGNIKPAGFYIAVEIAILLFSASCVLLLVRKTNP